MPNQCAAPQLTDKKQAEVSLGSYLNGRFELAANYSPVRHLLVRAAANSRPANRNDSSYYAGRQYELAGGTYFPLGQRWLLGGLGGYGWARSHSRYQDGISIIFKPPQHEFEARYTKVFGEGYVSYQAGEYVSLGAAYRIVRVDFSRLTDLGLPVPVGAMSRGEPMLFLRARLAALPALRLNLALGSSTTFGYDERTRYSVSSAEAQVLKSRGYLTLGLTLQPHLFPKSIKTE